VPRRSAMSFEVSPSGEARSSSMIRSEKSDIHHSPDGVRLAGQLAPAPRAVVNFRMRAKDCEGALRRRTLESRTRSR
jgi:hypothetical protein